MDFQDILKNNKYDNDSLIKYGFKSIGNDYCYETDLNEHFKMSIILNSRHFKVLVCDSKTDEEYLPFRVETINGSYVQKIRDMVNDKVDDILEKCFTKSKLLDEVLEYTRIKYGTIPDKPFGDDSLVLRVNNKWYALIMQIDKKKLGDYQGKCLIMNLKIDKDKIPHIIDNINIFTCYHMNKKYWITVVIDNNLDMNYLYELIDESYGLVIK